MDRILEKNILPDWIIRVGIRRLLAQRLRDENRGSEQTRKEKLEQLIQSMKSSPIAVNTDDANTQHYEVPTRFFQLVLGKHLKYSSGYWENGARSLDEGESSMLRLTCERAQIKNGQNILELGCGWGSLSLYLAEHYPDSQITGVSNSATQKTYIESEADKRGLKNLNIITANMNRFEAEETFDRVISVEMFEHMRNLEQLMKKIHGWLKPGGLLFVHIFTHRTLAYFFEDRGPGDWMARYFFTGGMMPSDDLLLQFQNGLKLEERWRVNGNHYANTAEAWLKNMDQNEAEIRRLFASVYGKNQVTRWIVYWRVFFMSCAELWAYRNGEEWLVSHYTFKRIH